MKNNTAPKLLILITSCEKNKEHREIIRRTWLKQFSKEQPYLFVVGDGKDQINGDVLEVSAPDTYEGCAVKQYKSIEYCLNNFEFDYLFCCDDDTYVVADRLLDCPFTKYDYYGAGPTCPDMNHYEKKIFYVQGGAGIFLSKKAAQTIANYPIDGPAVTESPWSDMMVGKIMKQAGFKHNYEDESYFCMGITHTTYPHKKYNRIITCHKVPHPDGMLYASLEMNPFLAFDKVFCVNPDGTELMKNQLMEAGVLDYENFQGTIKDLVRFCKQQKIESFLAIKPNARFVDGIIDLMVEPVRTLCFSKDDSWEIFTMGCELKETERQDDQLFRVISGSNHQVIGVHQRAYDRILELCDKDFDDWLQTQSELAVVVPKYNLVLTEQSPELQYQIMFGPPIEYPIRVGIVISIFHRGGTEYEICEMIANSDPSKIQYTGIAVQNVTNNGDHNGKARFEYPERLKESGIKFYCGYKVPDLPDTIEACDSFEEAIEKVANESDVILRVSVQNPFLEKLPHPSIMLSNIFSEWIRNIYRNSKADYYVGNSNHSCKIFPKYAKPITIYSGRNQEKVQPTIGREAQRTLWKIEPNDILVTYTGRLKFDKNLKVIAKAVSLLPENYKLAFVGECDFDKAETVYLCEKYLPNRHVIDTWQPNLGDTMAASDLFVMASDYEGFSNSLAEAWQTGLPTVFTRCGAVMELTEKYGKIGTEVPVNPTPEKLAEKIEEAWDNRNEPFVQNAQDIMKNFTLEKSAKEWEMLYEQLYREKSLENPIQVGLINPPKYWIVPKLAPRNKVKFHVSELPSKLDLIISFSDQPVPASKCPVLLVGAGQNMADGVCKMASFFCALSEDAKSGFPESLRKSVVTLQTEEYESLTVKKWVAYIEHITSRIYREPLYLKKLLIKLLRTNKTKATASKLNIMNVPPPEGHLEWTYINLAQMADDLKIPYTH